MNKCFLLGHLGKDMEVKYTPSGTAIGSFSMATSEKWRDNGGQLQERTEWHRIKIFGKTAETLRDYLVKGKQVLIEGRIQTRSWEKDGKKQYATEIVGDRVTLLGGTNGGGKRRNSAFDEESDGDAGYDTSSKDGVAPPDDIIIPF